MPQFSFKSIVLLALLCFPLQALGQSAELTSEDRLALLYTSQLLFDDAQVPIVKVGIADELEQLVFEPKGPIVVLPTGPGGPEIELPAKKSYTVRISDGREGVYEYFIVLGRYMPDETAQVEADEAIWKERQQPTQRLELGSLFAIAGVMFDNRETLLLAPPFVSYDEAKTQLETLSQLYNLEGSIHTELASYPGGTLTLEAKGEDFVVRHQDVLWVDLGDQEAKVSDVPTEHGKLEDRRYTGGLIFTADRAGKLAFINEVSAEELLRGVVPAEIFATAPAEALKVQAVAARGTLLSQLGVRHLADPYNLCDEQHCQVFAGMQSAKDSTDEAIKATQGAILFAGKRIAETYYSSNNGGISGTADEVWGLPSRDYLVARMDTAEGAKGAQFEGWDEASLRAFLESSPEAFSNTDAYSSGRHYRWSKSFSAKEMKAVVAKKAPGLGAIEDIVIHERGPSGRVTKLEVIGEEGSHHVERELPVRRLFGGLKSGLFVLDIERDAEGKATSFTFTGGGFGHGVGMSQTGAMGMGLEGFSFKEILDHYYPTTDVKTLW